MTFLKCQNNIMKRMHTFLQISLNLSDDYDCEQVTLLDFLMYKMGKIIFTLYALIFLKEHMTTLII